MAAKIAYAVDSREELGKKFEQLKVEIRTKPQTLMEYDKYLEVSILVTAPALDDYRPIEERVSLEVMDSFGSNKKRDLKNTIRSTTIAAYQELFSKMPVIDDWQTEESYIKESMGAFADQLSKKLEEVTGIECYAPWRFPEVAVVGLIRGVAMGRKKELETQKNWESLETNRVGKVMNEIKMEAQTWERRYMKPGKTSYTFEPPKVAGR